MIHPGRQPRQRQQGAIAMFAALGISVMISVLAILDIGFLYHYKRDYQKAADLAALAGTEELRAACEDAKNRATTSAQANLGNTGVQSILPECGVWEKGDEDTPSSFTPDSGVDRNALRVTVSGNPPRFLIPGERTITATAVAVAQRPQASLNIRSTLVSLEDGVVNALLGALLGSNVSLNVVGWEGVANADVNLLDFLNELAFLEGIEVSADIGTYENLLAADVSLLNLVNATIEAVGPESIAGVNLGLLRTDLLDLTLGGLEIPLGDLLSLGLGTETAGLDLGVNAFDLVQAFVQAASAEHALAAGVGVNLPGVAGVSLRASVIEPPQIAVVGNPARIDPVDPRNGDGRIYVRTAQVRLLLGVDLGVLGLLNEVLAHLPLLNLEVLGSDLDVGLNVGGAEAWVTDHNCALDGDKSLDVDTATAAANLGVGVYSPAALNDFFGSGTPFPDADLLNILSLSVGPITVAKIGISANVPVAESSQSLVYDNLPPEPEQLPEISDPESDDMYQQISSQDIVASLSNTLTGLELEVTILNSELLGNLLEGVLALVGNLVLAPLSLLLDPIVNALLNILGVNLAEADVGARMSCMLGGAALVH
ncbi:TadG family pilus assembly protein [Algiphilus sp.]|uniref:TadG family pilus assembly protein n=1 Tax=Algiphilus sp. TaxID=1872431 RepID=UPI0025C05A19|nr:TadG family pilus assembly protein [Algiphilus sp.]MCK5770256.1 hypothetical protein [Algiphilus sp.]